MTTYRIHTEADSRSNRRSRVWTVEADTKDDAKFEATMRHVALVRGNPSIWIPSIECGACGWKSRGFDRDADPREVANEHATCAAEVVAEAVAR